MPSEMIEKTAYYCSAVDRLVTRLTERYERQGQIALSDVIHVARSVLSDIEAPEAVRYEFPVAVGETVKCICKEDDEYGNPVVSLLPYRVAGVAFYKGKYYVYDDFGERNEVGTENCILPIKEEKVNASEI